MPGAQVELVPLDSTHPQQLLEWLVTGPKADVFLLPVQTIAALKRTGALMTLAGSRWHGLEQALYNFPPGMRQAYSEDAALWACLSRRTSPSSSITRA